MKARGKIGAGVGAVLSFVFAYTVFGINTFATKTVLPSSIKPVIPIVREYSQDELLAMEPYERNIAEIQTPEEVEGDMIRNFEYDFEEERTRMEFVVRFPSIFVISRSKGESFGDNYDKGKGVCVDESLMALGKLSDNGYPPYVLLMANSEMSHATGIHRTNEGFGALGLVHVKPEHKTIESLMDEISKGEDFGTFRDYTIVNLDDMYSDRKWIHGEVDSVKHFPNVRSLEARVEILKRNVDRYTDAGLKKIWGFSD